MEHIAYLRVSSEDQNSERQLADVRVQFDTTFTDKCSGSTTERPQLQALMRHVRSGDVIHVHSIDRLARSLTDLKQLVTQWNAKGVTIVFHKEGLTFSSDANNPTSNLMLSILGAVAEFERSMIKERQKEGIVKAKLAGKYAGRQSNKANHDAIRRLHQEGISIRKIAERVGCNPSTVQRVLKAKEGGNA